MNTKQTDTTALLQALEVLIADSDEAKASVLHAAYQRIKRQDFTIQRMAKDLRITTNYLERTIKDLEQSNEQLAIHAENRFRNIFEHTLDGIFLYNVQENKILMFNQALLDIFDYTADSFPCQSLACLFTQRQASGQSSQVFLDLYLQEAQTKQQGLKFEAQCLRSNGVAFEVSAMVVPHIGHAEEVYFVMRDISVQVRAERRLQERERLYSAVINHSFEGIDIIDVTNYHPHHPEQSKLLIRNAVMAGIFRTATAPMVHLSELREILPELQADGQRSEEKLKQIITEGLTNGFCRHSSRLLLADGSFMDIDAVEQIITVGGRELLIRIYQNATQRNRQRELIETQLQELNKRQSQLERYIQSNMQLENFAYIASHDLQAPLRGIVSFSNLLERRLKDRLTPSEADYLGFIVDNAHNMRTLIHALLDFSKINNQKLLITTLSFDHLVVDWLAGLQPLIHEAQASIQLQAMPVHLYGDEIKLRQLFQNLVTNALKFRQVNRPVKIEVGYDDNESHHIFWVKDNGIGIPQGFQDQIFLIFKRLHGQEAYKGTGIGLAICKKVVELHQGEIWIASQEDQGSTFYFSIKKNLQPTKPSVKAEVLTFNEV